MSRTNAGTPPKPRVPFFPSWEHRSQRCRIPLTTCSTSRALRAPPCISRGSISACSLHPFSTCLQRPIRSVRSSPSCSPGVSSTAIRGSSRLPCRISCAMHGNSRATSIPPPSNSAPPRKTAKPSSMCATMAPDSIRARPTAFSNHSSASIPPPNFPAPASVLPRCSASFAATAEKCGPKVESKKALHSTSPLTCPSDGNLLGTAPVILSGARPSPQERPHLRMGQAERRLRFCFLHACTWVPLSCLCQGAPLEQSGPPPATVRTCSPAATRTISASHHRFEQVVLMPASEAVQPALVLFATELDLQRRAICRVRRHPHQARTSSKDRVAQAGRSLCRALFRCCLHVDLHRRSRVDPQHKFSRRTEAAPYSRCILCELRPHLRRPNRDG